MAGALALEAKFSPVHLAVFLAIPKAQDILDARACRQWGA